MSPFGWGVAATVFFTCLLLAGGAQIKRQINLPPEISQHCIDTFFGLLSSPDGGACLTRLGESVGIENGTIVIELTVDQLEFTCGSTGCQLAFVSLIGACENEVRSAIGLPDVVDLIDFLLLLCVRDPSGTYCYHELEAPILRNDHDPLLLCNLRTSQQLCSDDCRAALEQRTSTCCLVTYLYLVASNSAEQQMIATSGIWQSCGLTAPPVCSNVTSNTQPNNTGNGCVDGNSNGNGNGNSDGIRDGNNDGNHDDDDDDDDNSGVVVGAVIGGLVFIALVAILVVLIIHLVLRYRTRSYGVSSRGDEMKVEFANHEHTEAMTT